MRDITMPNKCRWLLIILVTTVTSACRSPLTLQDDGSGRPMPPLLPTHQAKLADALLANSRGDSQAAQSLKRARAIVEGQEPTSAVVTTSAKLGSKANASGYTARLSDWNPKPDVEVAEPTNSDVLSLQNMSQEQGLTARRLGLGNVVDELSRQTRRPKRIAAIQPIPDLESPFLDDPDVLDDLQPLVDVVPSELNDVQVDLGPSAEVNLSDSMEYTVPSGPTNVSESWESAPVVEYPLGDYPVYGEVVDGGQYPANQDATCFPSAPCAVPEARVVEPWRIYHDEYICDGGDANSSVSVRNDWSLRNLDPEDTVGHYDTLAGEVIVEPSNRVCIYAPRFAATRKVTALHQNEEFLMPLTANEKLVPVVEDLQQFPDQFSQNVEAQRHLKILPPAEFRDRLPPTVAIQGVGLLVLDRDLPPHEDFRIIKFGVHKQAEKARLAEFTQRAITWSRDVTVQVILDETAARTKFSVQDTEQIFSIGEGTPKFRVIKTASVEDALPGEEVEFTLRFDNVGHQVIGNVTIIDNLSTRLEYIPDSAFCTVEAELITTANEAESLTLRWEIADPLKVGDGGIIRFKCRVR